MRNIHFIINPNSGKGKNLLTRELIDTYLKPNAYRVTIIHTKSRKHALKVTQYAVADNAETIVACGGDGTVNQIASLLVGTTIKLGIIPFGSGNGLASTLGISKNIHEALSLISKNETTTIDVGTLNDHHFFSNTGIGGFDASVIKYYGKSTDRKIKGYSKAVLKALTTINSGKENNVTINNDLKFKNPFLVFISNSNEMGYNLSLTPKASIQDGILDVLIIPKIGVFKILLFGIYVILKKPNLFKSAIHFQTKKLTYLSDNLEKLEVQIDGDSRKIKSAVIHVGIKAGALTVIN